MAIEGPLKELEIHDVFQLLDLSRKTGALRVTSDLRHNQGTVYFQSGAVIHAEIRSNPHRLGDLLVRAGKCTEADLERARDLQRRGDARRIGAILVEMGSIQNRDLEGLVKFQIEEVIFEMMSWREGFFSFSEESISEIEAEATLRVPIEALLLEGARRIDEWSQIERKIPHLSVVPTFAMPPQGGGGALDLLPSEWELLATVDGRQDIRSIAASLARSEFDVAKTFFGLESAGVVTLLDRPPASAAPGGGATETVAEAEKALQRGQGEAARAMVDGALQRHPHDAGLYLVMGKINQAAERYADAEENFRRTLRLDPLLAPAHRLLGDVLALRGRLAEAVEWWERWLKLGEDTGVLAPDADEVRRAVHAARTLNNVLGASGG